MIRTHFGLLIAALIALVIISLVGCDEDERLVQLSEKAADRQAAQNQEMTKLNREVAESTKRLVTADAESRKELVSLQRDLQVEQSEIGDQRDQLEAERKQIAEQRHRDPIIANAITGIGVLLACLAPLLLCWYLLRGVRDESDDAIVADVLIEELSSSQPRLLLSAQTDRDALGRDQPCHPPLTAATDPDADEEPGG